MNGLRTRQRDELHHADLGVAGLQRRTRSHLGQDENIDQFASKRKNGETSPRAQQEDIGKRVQEQTAIMTVHIGATLLSPRPVHRQSYGKHSSLLSAKAKLGTTLLCLQWR